MLLGGVYGGGRMDKSSVLGERTLAIEGESAGGAVINVFTSGEGGWECYKIPTLFTTSSGVLIAIAEARGGDCMDWQDTDLVMKRSLDGGATWDTDVTLMVPGGYGKHNVAGNIAIVQDKTTGKIWMPFTRGNWGFYMTSSTDDGLTWKEPYELHGLKNMFETWVGFGPPSGLQTTSGRLILPAYASSVPFYDNGIFTYSFVVYSDDNGLTWKRGQNVPSGGWFMDFFSGNFGNEAEIIEFETSKRLLINSRAAWGKRIQSYSEDDGDTWSTFEDTDLPNPMMGCEGSIVSLGDDNGVLFSGPNTAEVIRTKMTVYKSPDQGKQWLESYEVDTTLSATVGYSSMIRKNDGVTAIIWGRSLEEETLFVPDYISYRTLPTSLHGAARDVSGHASPSGVAEDMSWVNTLGKFEKFHGTIPFYCLMGGNYILLVMQIIVYGLRVVVYCKKRTKRNDNVKTGAEVKRCCNLGCCFRVMFRRVFVFFGLLVSAVGVAAEQIFQLDDGMRWIYQSLNVLGFQAACLILLVLLPWICCGRKKGEEGELDLSELTVASAPPVGDVELGRGESMRRVSL
ncbi:hypothetical protein TrVE_jg9302 [Triparma verrucosa]|uniref:Sialidase domain-containing protein n=1 Tax=Triparma verrucosa TaxID=1606542 RepID=A0A9W7FB26_9STRA|nr:hypothetical protein TrVE_jg9302 [Triparma verrucosa]